MLLQENLLPYIKEHLRQQQIYGTCPFTFNLDNILVEKTWNWLHKLVYSLKKTLWLIYTSVLWLQLLLTVGKEPVTNSIVSFLYSATTVVIYLAQWIMTKRASNIVEFFNLILQFELRHMSGNGNSLK